MHLKRPENCLFSGEGRTQRYSARLEQIRSRTPTRLAPEAKPGMPAMVDRLDVYIKYEHSFFVLARILNYHKHKHFILALHTLKSCRLPQHFHFQQAFNRLASLHSSRLRLGLAQVKLWAKAAVADRLQSLSLRLKRCSVLALTKALLAALLRPATLALQRQSFRSKRLALASALVAKAQARFVAWAFGHLRSVR
jgi:hypothetical protein